MHVEIVIPQVGEAIAAITLAKWMKEPGESVEKGEVLFLVDTEKAILEVEAFAEGILKEILVSEGSSVMPKQVVGILQTTVEDTVQSSRNSVAANSVTEYETAKSPRVSPLARRVAQELDVDIITVTGTSPDGRITANDVHRTAEEGARKLLTSQEQEPIPISPKARRMAKEHSLDPSQISGTGIDGLITVEDIENALKTSSMDLPTESATVVPLSRRRQAIARSVTHSKQTIPHFYLLVDVDMSQAANLRDYCHESLGWDRPPTYTDILVRACGLTLSALPQFNVSYHDEGLLARESVDIGIAVGLDDGLIVPVLPKADQLDLAETSRKISALVERAHSGKLRELDLGDKSLVVSNLGMYGVDAFIAIIEAPNPMIIAMGQVKDRLVPLDGQAVIRPFASLALSMDHRAFDGVQAANFLGSVKKRIEAPFELLR
jgi:pyruvate dehydrogenase E2 component (dihydrolipoamide acetyltransferase)